jgi:hypothetical protein
MSTTTAERFSPLRLRPGEVLRNRIAKAAMEEGMPGPPAARATSTYN